MLMRILLVTLFLVSVSAQAATVEGIIDLQGSDVFLRLKNGTHALQVFGMNTAVLDTMKKLSQGDFVVGAGNIYVDKKVISLDSIDIVGLKQILGMWVTDTWELFEFKNFSLLNLYVPQPVRPLTSYAHLKKIDYTLAPVSGARWSIFMADDRSVHIGTLEIRDKKIEIELLDQSTGHVHESISLSPLNAEP